MYIGELAKLSGSTPKAIRHYEFLGLLGQVARQGVYRVYSAQDLQLLLWIKQAQRLGFRLSELVSALQRGSNGELDWASFAKEIDKKRTQIQNEIQRLQCLDLDLQQINQEIQSCLNNPSV